MNKKPLISKKEAEEQILEESKANPLYWLSCGSELLQFGFSKSEISKAIKQAKISVDDLTDKEDFEHDHEPQKSELVRDYHTSNHIRVYKDVLVDGQYIRMEGCRKGRVKTLRVVGHYQGLKHEKIIRKLLENRFKWFNKFNWNIYELCSFEHYEIYLKTEKGTLYIPMEAILNKKFKMIDERMFDYFKDYKLSSSYELNKKAGESFLDFTERKVKEFGKSLEPLRSKEAEELKKYFGRQEKEPLTKVEWVCAYCKNENIRRPNCSHCGLTKARAEELKKEGRTYETD